MIIFSCVQGGKEPMISLSPIRDDDFVFILHLRRERDEILVRNRIDCGAELPGYEMKGMKHAWCPSGEAGS